MQLQNDPKCTQILQNILKHYFRVQWGDWVCPLRKIPMWLRGTNFWINCTNSTHFAPSFMQLRIIPNAPKHYETHQNMSLGSNGVDWVVHCEKSGRGFVARTFAIIAPVHTVLHRVSCSYETITNAPKHNETYENISLGSNGGSLWKIPTWLRGMKFCINCTSSPYFASSIMELRNDPKCTQTLYNAPKHEFRVQWGGLGAFFVKNPNVTSWHKLWL